MEILASCSYEESIKFDGKLVVEGEEGSKPDKVSLNIVIENGGTSILSTIKPCVKCITLHSGVEIGSEVIDCKTDIFVEVPLEEALQNGIEEYKQDGITILIRTSEGYSDMRVLKGLCEKYENVRVIGGNFLNIDGVRIGRYDIGKDKGSSVYNGIYDQFLEIPLSEIGNLKDVVKKARKKLNSPSDSKQGSSAKVKKVVSKKSDISKSFSTLFSGVSEEF